ncbi:DUF3192 domain-containing protein [Thalassotalea ponticola]|uniref:DUF3192 domain-containing protein n=1 Tax=Thalassotalea ponticola TaxID=1523392 RepID=UPI0025B2B1BB|nr:DUF3192 domain-containing protein [Thalassotalea ponticola]MDN3652596.1 DUF3192 domain-containing protein [Thalassotalea ponticola]
MKKSLSALLVIAPLVVTLPGCIVVSTDKDGESIHFNRADTEYENRKKIAQLQIGTPYQQALEMMGVADFSEVYEKDGQTIQVLFYRTNRKQADGMTTKDECTPLVFKQGKLTSWGDSAYLQI